jgi:hypothetical protein
MTQNDWVLLMCLAIGWLLWRRPQLKYHGVEE